MRLLRRCGWLAGLGAATVLVALFGVASSAEGAFPGRNGLLAVQPLKGLGVVLVKANGRGVRRVCRAGSACANGCFVGSPCADYAQLPRPYPSLRPVWSPDGRALAVFGKTASSVIYGDGSCLVCSPGSLPFGDRVNPAAVFPVYAVFTVDPTLLTMWQPRSGNLTELGVDGMWKGALLSGASDPAWSSHGELAVVQAGWIWVGSPGPPVAQTPPGPIPSPSTKLRRLTPGSAPSWSPGGGQIVFDRHGWVMIGRVGGHSFRRLVRGTAPTWSPDGRSVAFFDTRHRLKIVSAKGGLAHYVGKVTGKTVDWQPLPAKPPVCPSPPASTVIARSDTGDVSLDTSPLFGGGSAALGSPLHGGWAILGCLRATGRQRLLTIPGLIPSGPGIGPSSVTEAAVAGNYAALAVNTSGGRYGAYVLGSRTSVFDLRTGASVRGGEAVSCNGREPTSSPPPPCQIDQLVLGSDAVSAVHTTAVDNGCTCTVEQIQASDSTGVHTLDSVTEADGSPPALTNLTLTGDTLTWQHHGELRSAKLQP